MTDTDNLAGLVERPWQDAAPQICDAVLAQMPDVLSRITVDLYERLMTETQDYLKENVEFNLNSQLDAANRQAQSDREALRAAEAQVARLREALRMIASGVDENKEPLERGQMEAIADEALCTPTEAGEREPTSHASTSPGPINCNVRLRLQKEGYPRTCARCGLGPCPFFHEDGAAKDLRASAPKNGERG